MTARIPLFEFMPYGAPELLAASRNHMLRAQAASCALMIALFATAMYVVPRTVRPPEIVVLRPPICPVLPPMPMVKPQAPTLPHAPIAPAPSGIVLPVPNEMPIDEVIAPPSATAFTGTGTTEVPGYVEPGTVIGAPPVLEDTLPARGVPVHVDQPPVAIAQPRPNYPDIAREAGIEGNVRVYILIGKDGHVLRAELDDKVHVPMLDASALEGAKRWVFTPAYVNGHPVAVWETLPFEFTLH